MGKVQFTVHDEPNLMHSGILSRKMEITGKVLPGISEAVEYVENALLVFKIIVRFPVYK